MSKTYRVAIHERLTKYVDIKAEDEEEAKDKVQNKYECQEIILTSDDYVETKIEVEDT